MYLTDHLQLYRSLVPPSPNSNASAQRPAPTPRAASLLRLNSLQDALPPEQPLAMNQGSDSNPSNNNQQQQQQPDQSSTISSARSQGTQSSAYSSSSSTSSSLSGSYIAAIVLVTLFVVALLAFCCCRARRRRALVKRAEVEEEERREEGGDARSMITPFDWSMMRQLRSGSGRADGEGAVRGAEAGVVRAVTPPVEGQEQLPSYGEPVSLLSYELASLSLASTDLLNFAEQATVDRARPVGRR
jgi:hypothetical protein